MSIRQGMKAGPHAGNQSAESGVSGSSDTHAPRKLTFAENVIVTMKVLAGFALLGVALWGIDLWITK